MAAQRATGAVFKVSATGNMLTSLPLIASFTGTSGAELGSHPNGSLVIDNSGNIFGTTASGGVNNNGTLFEIFSNNSFKTLVSFKSSSTVGNTPIGQLILDSSGKLFGVTANGGKNNVGTLFEFDPNNGTAGTFSSLFQFTTSTSGSHPTGPLLENATSGQFFGTTFNGGKYGGGAVFTISPN